MVTFFDRSGIWWLDRQTLQDFAAGRAFWRRKKIYIGMLDVEPKALKDRAYNFGSMVHVGDDKVTIETDIAVISIRLWYTKGNKAISRGKCVPRNWFVGSAKDTRGLKHGSLTKHGLFRYNINQVLPYTMCTPFSAGAVLDDIEPLWFVNQKFPDRDETNAFFTASRRKNAYRTIAGMYRCAAAAGISPERVWLGFGGLLGIVREGDFILNDNDIDMCINMSKDGKPERKYLEYLHQTGFFEPDKKHKDHFRKMVEKREKAPAWRKDPKCPVWTSIGPMGIEHEDGVKSCNWFWFNHNGYAWHSKGGKWTRPKKFDGKVFPYTDKDAAIAKGMPKELVAEMVPYNFHGVDIFIPKRAGACCDWWYPGWLRPAKGSSVKKVVMIVGKWEDKRTWRIV